ncbi:hypothetical protein QTI34_10850 [Clostridium perfringens]|nr:hypothetical protein [Clostridium perfringens]
MSINISNFKTTISTIFYDNTSIATNDILKSIVDTNNYLIKTTSSFNTLGFDLLSALNQRNISGTIGEIFKHFFCLNINNYTPNPHADGRPDILNLETTEAKEYFYSKCINTIDGKTIANKYFLTPFKYGGVEVKFTIGGTPSKSSKIKLSKDTNFSSFDIGVPRIEYIPNINWGSHHAHSLNLLGLYYDYYYVKDKYYPQILGAFFSPIEKSDWREVCRGSSNSKTTSATSLLPSGVLKMKSNCIIYIDDELYMYNFKRLKINI